MDKENVICTYNGISLSLKKRNTSIYNKTDEPEGYYAKWNKPVVEGQTLHDAT